MKLVRHGEPGREKPGLIDAEGGVRDLSGVVDDIFGPMLSGEGLARCRSSIQAGLARVPEGTRLGPCIGGVGKIIGVGLNYRDHIEQAGAATPRVPTLFMKAPSSICGPYDDVIVPGTSKETDWEVELGVVIGRIAIGISSASALEHVAGYCLVNDITEREWIRTSGQLLNGKCADTFTPTGPWLLTADELPDPQDVHLSLDLNGVRRQTGHTGSMIFQVAELISHISRLMTLQPGDLVLTGTPAGTGMRSTPSEYLKAGDRLCLKSPKLGEQRNRVTAQTT